MKGILLAVVLAVTVGVFVGVVSYARGEAAASRAAETRALLERDTAVAEVRQQIQALAAVLGEQQKSILANALARNSDLFVGALAQQQELLGQFQGQFQKEQKEGEAFSRASELITSLGSRNAVLWEETNRSLEERAQLFRQNKELSDALDQVEGYLARLTLGQGQAQCQGYTIVPVYFVPSDVVPDPKHTEEIAKSVAFVRAWYTNIVGRPFAAERVQTVNSSYGFAWFQEKNSNVENELAWEKVLEEVDRLMPGKTSPKRVPLVFVEGSWLASNRIGWATEGTFAMVGDFAIRGISDENHHAAIGTKNAQRGTIVHELGHVFGLPHSNYVNSIMNVQPPTYADFPKVDFAQVEIEILRKSPFFQQGC